MNRSDRSHYEVLNVLNNASLEEIRTKYRSRVLETHPDRVRGKEEEFKRVTEAFRILSDASQREEYDESLKVQEGLDPTKFTSPLNVTDPTRVADVIGQRNPAQTAASTVGARASVCRDDERARFRAHLKAKEAPLNEAEFQHRLKARSATVVKVGSGGGTLSLVIGATITLGALLIMAR